MALYSFTLRSYVIKRTFELIHTPKGSVDKAIRYLRGKRDWLTPQEFDSTMEMLLNHPSR